MKRGCSTQDFKAALGRKKTKKYRFLWKTVFVFMIEYASEKGCRTIITPTSDMAAAALDEYGDEVMKDPAAGIAAIMKPQLAARLRGKPKRSISGRLLHLTFGDGQLPKDDKNPLHVIAVYGLSGEARETGARASLAQTLAKELRETLDSISGERVLIYGDINTVEFEADRVTGTKNAADEAPYALWKVLSDDKYKLRDVMTEACEDREPPMTYLLKGNPISRIDLMKVGGNIGKVYGGTGATLGNLSATHAAMVCSFDGPDFETLKTTPDSRSPQAMEHVVAILSNSGGRRWNLNSKSTWRYSNVVFEESRMKKRLQKVREQASKAMEEAMADTNEENQKSRVAAVQAEAFTEYADLLLFAECMAKEQEVQQKGVKEITQIFKGNITIRNATEALRKDLEDYKQAQTDRHRQTPIKNASRSKSKTLLIHCDGWR